MWALFSLTGLIAGIGLTPAFAIEQYRVLPLSFDTDTPCLNNSGHVVGLRDQRTFLDDTGPLGALAATGGACHGLSRWVAVSAQNLEYRCTPEDLRRAPDFARYAQQLRRAHFLWENGCTNRLQVEGICNLRDACLRSTAESRQLVVALNAGGTIDRGLGNLLTTLRDLHTDSLRSARNTYQVIRSALREIDRGRYPILYRFNHADSTYGHMLVLHGYSLRTFEGSEYLAETQTVELHLYDPNSPGEPTTQTVILYPTRRQGISRSWGEMLSDFLMPWDRGERRMARSECERLVRQWEFEDSRASDGWNPGF
jgi:hypothetical protein